MLREAHELHEELQPRLQAATPSNPNTRAEIRLEAARELAAQRQRKRKRAREDCKQLFKAYLKLMADGQGLGRLYFQLERPWVVDLRSEKHQLPF